MIENGKQVKFNFTLRADGKIIESSKGVPVEYVYGEDDILPGLKEGMQGLEVGDEKAIVLEPENAYGPEDEEAYEDLPLDDLPDEIDPEVGLPLEIKNGAGQKSLGIISKINEDSVTLNFNHPLAGKTLTYFVKIMEIQ